MTDGELARALSVHKTTVRNWRHERVWPTDDAMMVLCSFADIEPQIGLMLLNIWRSTGRTRATYMEMLKRATAEKRISDNKNPELTSASTAKEQIHIR